MSIQQLFVDSGIAGHPIVQRFSSKLGLSSQLIDDPQEVFDLVKSSDDPWKRGKEVLWLTRNKGAFLKKCPGTRDYLCCGYQILHIGTYCTMDCAYCILQGYFHPPILQYFVNFDDITTELNSIFKSGKTMRIGTGEFTDSLIWEEWSDLTPRLVRQFAGQQKAVLELKTKTVAIDQLDKLDHDRKTILSWSVNTPRIIQSQERGTASLKARLRAAATSDKRGYPLSFHFDPMVIYPDCEKEYIGVLEQIFNHVPSDNIVWISMGTFRCMPALHSIIKKRFPESNIIYGEFVPGLDGKMRYFKELRIDLYKKMARWMQKNAPDVLLYFCMESDQVWERSFGYSPESKGGLAAMLDDSARRHCGLK